MGLVFEEDKAKGQVVVADFVEGSEAEKRNKVSIFFPQALRAVRAVQMSVASEEHTSAQVSFRLAVCALLSSNTNQLFVFWQ